MSFKAELAKECQLRQDCVQADYERLTALGADPVALERLIEHSLQIGIILDKLNNLQIRELLRGKDEDERDVGRIKNVPHSKKKRSEKTTARPE